MGRLKMLFLMAVGLIAASEIAEAQIPGVHKPDGRHLRLLKFVGQSLSPVPFDQAAMAGKVVVLTGMPSVEAGLLRHLRHMRDLHAKYWNKNVMFVAAYDNRRPGENDREMLVKEHIDFPVIESIGAPIADDRVPLGLQSELAIYSTSGALFHRGRADERDTLRKLAEAVRDNGKTPNAFPPGQTKTGDLVPMGPLTDQQGRTVEAAVVKVTGDQVTLRLKDGRVLNYAMANLSAESAAKIKAASIVK